MLHILPTGIKRNQNESLIPKESDGICVIKVVGSQLAGCSVLNVRLALSSDLVTPVAEVP